jgi:lipopolysaccharide/colanic/teichoic acid biosynthesis glycosyltransferase
MNEREQPSTSLPGVKRLLDLAAATLCLLLLGPVLWAIVFLVWLETRRPVLLRELRRGYHGRLFQMLSFRTTTDDGEQQSSCEDPAETSCTGQFAGQESALRVTPIGRLLRSLALDELPQLFNVLQGEMTLVGPRPLSIAESDRLREQDPEEYEHRLEVMPGVWHFAREGDWNHSS